MRDSRGDTQLATTAGHTTASRQPHNANDSGSNLVVHETLTSKGKLVKQREIKKVKKEEQTKGNTQRQKLGEREKVDDQFDHMIGEFSRF